MGGDDHTIQSERPSLVKYRGKFLRNDMSQGYHQNVLPFISV